MKIIVNPVLFITCSYFAVMIHLITITLFQVMVIRCLREPSFTISVPPSSDLGLSMTHVCAISLVMLISRKIATL